MKKTSSLIFFLLFFLNCYAQNCNCDRADDTYLFLLVKNSTKVKMLIELSSQDSIAVKFENNYVKIPSNQAFNWDYEENYTGIINIKIPAHTQIKKLELYGSFYVNIDHLHLTGIERLIIGNMNFEAPYAIGDLSEYINTLKYVDISGGEISGELLNFNNNLDRLRVTGKNTLKFNIEHLPNTITYLGVTGLNKIYGNISNLNAPLLHHFDIKGHNTITGNYGHIPSIEIFALDGNNQVEDYTSFFPDAYSIFIHPGTEGFPLSSSEIDQLLIDLATANWVSSKLLILTGHHAPRTALSDEAVLVLENKGVSVSTN